MFRMLKRMPFFRLLAIGRTTLLARRHFQRLTPHDRRRLADLVRHGHRLSAKERDELRRILGKMGPREFAVAAADAFSPIPIPRRLAGRTSR